MKRTSNFNPKVYQGKARVYSSVPRAPRVSRLWVWNESARKYQPPKNGKSYMVKRYERDDLGRRQRIVRFFVSMEEARIWQSGAEVDKATEVPKKPVKTGPLFREIVVQWKKRRYPQLAPGTRIQYDKLIRIHLESLMKLTIHEITCERIDNWIDELKSPSRVVVKSRPRKSFDHELTLLATILNYYVEYHDDSEFNYPILRRHRKAIQLNRSLTIVQKNKHKNLSEDLFLQFRETLATLRHGDLLAALATTQYFQALRISEAAGLYWEDCHFDWMKPENSRISVVRSVFYPHKTGVASQIQDGFKNATANDGCKEQPMFPQTFEALGSLHIKGAKGLIFQMEGRHLEYRTVQYWYNRAFKLAGLPFTATHIMRHGGCRRVLRSGGNLELARQLMGNSTLKSISPYAILDASDLTELVGKHWEEKQGTLAANGCKRS